MDDTPITHAECLALFNSQSWAETTNKTYLGDFQDFVAYYEHRFQAPFDLRQASARDLRDYRDDLQGERGLRAGSVEKKLAPLRFLFKMALRKGWLVQNPMNGLKRLKQVETAPRWLDKTEQAALLRAMLQELEFAIRHYPARWRTYRRDVSLTIFLLNSGLRVAEACDVRLADVELSERKGSVLVRRGKGSKERRVPLNAHARKALQEWLAVRPESGTDHLWISVERSPHAALSERSVQRVLARYKQLAGLEHFSPHVCRHTFAKNLIDEAVGLEKVAKLLGHANLNTTKIYITPSEQDLALAVEKL